MITNCKKCGKAVVVARKDYKPKKGVFCRNCEGTGFMRKIFTSLKGAFSPKSSAIGIRPVGA